MPSDRPKKPHGAFTPASAIGRVLSAAKHKSWAVRGGVGLGGHVCRWGVWMGRVSIHYRCPDDMPESEMDEARSHMLDLYEELLTSKGYRVERTEACLYVDPNKEK